MTVSMHHGGRAHEVRCVSVFVSQHPIYNIFNVRGTARQRHLKTVILSLHNAAQPCTLLAFFKGF